MKPLSPKTSSGAPSTADIEKLTRRQCSDSPRQVLTATHATSATLIHLNFSAARKPRRIPEVVLRRNKLSKRLWEQIELAKSRSTGTALAITRLKRYRDPITGLSIQADVPKRIKAWWFTTDDGDLALSIRYGKNLLELSPGKPSILVPSLAELVPLLELIKNAVLAGELDDQLEIAALNLKSGFKIQSR